MYEINFRNNENRPQETLTIHSKPIDKLAIV